MWFFRPGPDYFIVHCPIPGIKYIICNQNKAVLAPQDYQELLGIWVLKLALIHNIFYVDNYHRILCCVDVVKIHFV